MAPSEKKSERKGRLWRDVSGLFPVCSPCDFFRSSHEEPSHVLSVSNHSLPLLHLVLRKWTRLAEK